MVVVVEETRSPEEAVFSALAARSRLLLFPIAILEHLIPDEVSW